MSKFCVLVFQCSSDVNYLKKQIETELNVHKLGIFYALDYVEPFLLDFPHENRLICSIADNQNYDNVEMLLLPDNCISNGKYNTVSFMERMQWLECILRIVLNQTGRLDLFIGDSGVHYDEFIHINTSIKDFLSATNALNSILSPDVHFTIVS